MPQPCSHQPSEGRAPSPGPVRWRARVLALVAAMAVALVGGVLASAATAVPAAAATSCSGPLADGQIRVVMVVDPGETGPRGPLATCLVVKAGSSGSAILAQRASELGLPSPRYAGSGLLCGIDGFPGSGCPVNEGGTYAYWAYFNGTGGSWSYGYDNPFVRRMADGEIMGWRYTTGSPDGGAPTPRIAPSSSLFPALAPPPAAPPAGGGGGGGGTSSGGGGTGGGGGGAAAPSGGPVLPDLSGLAGLAGATTTVPTAEDPAATDDTSTTVTTTDPAAAVTAEASDAASGEELAAEPVGSSGGSGAGWIGPVVIVVIAGALGVGAITRSRRRGRVSP